jgi:alkylation response protein AidB-like acyl-CoA dehydrogenase
MTSAETFVPPIRDIRFALEEVVAVDRLKAEGRFEDLSRDVLAALLEEAGRLAGDVLAPLNRVGDRDGATLANVAVTTAPGFREAYAAWVEGGWQGVCAPVEVGGMGLPRTVAAAVMEMVQSANSAFGLAPMLTNGAIEALSVHGAPEQRTKYLPKLVSGQWTGTMNLTEPHAGSDLGLLKTKAWKAPDGTYRIRGQKIWITWGEHDCAENIVHLVLARLEGAPAGVKGISLFIAPKFLVDEDGNLGARNDLKCIGLEHKMGIHASPTCVMSYGDGEGAVAELVGEENGGLKAMFTMMNAARIAVGIQGVGLAQRAYARALAFARDRRQGKTPSGDAPGRIVEHPDVRRMLLTMKAKTEAARALCYAASMAADEAEVLEPEDDRAWSKARESLLTPIAKAWSTDVANEVASLAVQVHGGQGFIEESGAPQHFRDARIAAIYEGTNGIQAIDLVGRKLQGDKGKAMAELVEDLRETAESLALSSNPELPPIGAQLGAGIDTLEQATAFMLDPGTPELDRLAGATAYLALAGDVVGGAFLGQGALAGQRILKETPDDAYAQSKVDLARFYVEATLSAVPGRLDAVTLGADALFDVPEELL